MPNAIPAALVRPVLTDSSYHKICKAVPLPAPFKSLIASYALPPIPLSAKPANQASSFKMRLEVVVRILAMRILAMLIAAVRLQPELAVLVFATLQAVQGVALQGPAPPAKTT